MNFIFENILSTRPDPLDILKSTARVLQLARVVRLDTARLERVADTLAHTRVEPPAWNFDLHFFDGSARTVNYLFLLDALNFCFWESPRWSVDYREKKLDGYWALAAALTRAVAENPRVVDAEFLAQITPNELAHILRGRGEIPLFAERWRNVRELGKVLRDHWNGDAARMVSAANGDAARLARMVAENFSSFNDVAVYKLQTSLREAKRRSNLLDNFGIASLPEFTLSESEGVARNDILEVHFFKRAQILVADLWGTFGGKELGAFKNIHALTAFADYKLPQILRAWGILKYAPQLARIVDAQKEIAAGSAPEVEIRAATLWAVEFLRDALGARGRALMSVQVDWILWQASQAKFANLKPYHRVRTIYY